MEQKIKIKISETAYDKLTGLLSKEKEYTSVRFSCSSGCCKSSKVELTLDNVNAGDLQDKVEELPIVYNSELTDNIKSITIIYRNSSFMVKTEQTEDSQKSCSSCNSSCHSGCKGCK